MARTISTLGPIGVLIYMMVQSGDNGAGATCGESVEIQRSRAE
jgi:hypothetical protein